MKNIDFNTSYRHRLMISRENMKGYMLAYIFVDFYLLKCFTINQVIQQWCDEERFVFNGILGKKSLDNFYISVNKAIIYQFKNGYG